MRDERYEQMVDVDLKLSKLVFHSFRHERKEILEYLESRIAELRMMG